MVMQPLSRYRRFLYMGEHPDRGRIDEEAAQDGMAALYRDVQTRKTVDFLVAESKVNA